MEILHDARPGHGISPEAIRPHMQAGFPWHEWETIQPANRTADEWWAALAQIFANAFEQGGGLPAADAVALGARVRHVFPDPARWRLFEDTQLALEKLTELGYRHVVLSNHVPELESLMEAQPDGCGIARYAKRRHSRQSRSELTELRRQQRKPALNESSSH